jgi:hypothetical protein
MHLIHPYTYMYLPVISQPPPISFKVQDVDGNLIRTQPATIIIVEEA